MKKLVLTFQVIALLFSSLHLTKLFGAEQFTVTMTVGEVWYRSGKTAQWTALTNGTVLPGDVLIKTGSRGSAVLGYGNKRITIGENRIVSLKEAAGDGGTGDERGLAALRYRLGNLLSDRKHVTQTTIVAVRGEKIRGSGELEWADDLTVPEKATTGNPLEKARQLYAKADYAGVVSTLDPLLPSMAGVEREEGLYLLFMACYSLGDYDQCLDLSDRIMVNHDISPRRRSAVLFLTALTHSSRGSCEDTTSLLGRFIIEYSDDPLAPEACFIMAGSYEMMGEYDKAGRYYRLIVEKYSKSPVAADAALKLKKKEDSR